MLRSLQNTNSQILLTKTPPGNLITDYNPKKKEKEKKKKSKHFCKPLLGILVGFS